MCSLFFWSPRSPSSIQCLITAIWSVNEAVLMWQDTNTLALHRSWESKANLISTNRVPLLAVGLEGGALLAVSAVRPSQLPAALWPPNNCRLSSLWAAAPCPRILLQDKWFCYLDTHEIWLEDMVMSWRQSWSIVVLREFGSLRKSSAARCYPYLPAKFGSSRG